MTAPGLSLDERFWLKVDKTRSCWLWTGATNDRGYPRFSYGPARGQRHVYAHRFAYEQLHGAIPEGMTVDHLCRVIRCVNPKHMELVTKQENTHRRWQTPRRRRTA